MSTNPQQIPTMPPEAIDAAIIQLDGMMSNTPGMPDDVKAAGGEFVKALDKWSADLKKKREEARVQGQPAQKV